jgi:Fe-S cluster biogenesis protein NfuA
MTAAPQNLRAAGDRIEQLLDELASTADARSYQRAEELLRLVTDLYGAGLGRVLDIVGERAPDVVGDLVHDELVGSLLLVHELHPDSLAQRVEGALAQVRPLLARHQGDVELVDIDPAAAAVRVRLLGSCDGCPSSSITLTSAVERAILEAAPEIVIIDVDEPTPGDRPAPTGVEVPVTLGAKPAVYDSCPSEMVP